MIPQQRQQLCLDANFLWWWWGAILTLISLVIPCFSLSSPPTSNVKYVAGRRCMVVPSTGTWSTDGAKRPPPIVLLGGMAQTISSWEHHMPGLSQKRPVLVYEGIGQGLPEPGTTRGFDYSNTSLPFQAETLMNTLDQLQDFCGQPVDLVGFSFGARVAMATACLYPDRIRKLHLTGVGTDRSDYAHLAVLSWKDCLSVATLQTDDATASSSSLMRPFAWSILLATYSPTFLQGQGTTRTERFVQHICDTNHPPGLLALLQQSEVNDPEHPWHVVSMANRLRNVRGHLCAGELDLMAPVEKVQQLCQLLGWQGEPSVIPNCAHAVGLEAPRLWRDNVLRFLDGRDDDNS
jgi:pimeloyl-ACP methyl ester carboxylesterase